MNKEALDYAESQAVRNVEFHLKNLESLSKEAHLTLSVLLAGIPAAFTFGLKFYNQTGMGTWGGALLLLSLYLWFVGVYLMGAIKPRPVYAPGNEPSKLEPVLNDPKFTLEEIREEELKNLQERITQNRLRCEDTGKIVNNSRKAILVSTLLFPLFAIIALIIRSAFLGITV